MTVEQLICPDCGDGHEGDVEMGEIEFCEVHDGEIRMALIQRGFAADLELDKEERRDRFLDGRPDALVALKNRLVMGCLQTFGGDMILSSGNGCPVCVFHSVIEQAADGVAVERTRKN